MGIQSLAHIRIVAGEEVSADSSIPAGSTDFGNAYQVDILHRNRIIPASQMGEKGE